MDGWKLPCNPSTLMFVWVSVGVNATAAAKRRRESERERAGITIIKPINLISLRPYEFGISDHLYVCMSVWTLYT